MRYLFFLASLFSVSIFSQENNFAALKANYTLNFIVNKEVDSVNLSTKMLQVKHQGVRNTCSAFASTALAEFVIKKDLKKEFDLSEAFTYYNAKNKALNNDFLKQSYEPVDGLAGYLAVEGFEYGCMEDNQWTYDGSSNWKDSNTVNCKVENGVSSKECFIGVPPKNAKKLDIKLKTVFIPLEKVDEFLLSGQRPEVVNIWIYKNGMNIKTGELTIPKEPILMGGHVILLTGYNKKNQMFTFRNSWGTEWGKNGYGSLSKKYLLEHFESNQSIKQIDFLNKDQKEYLTKVSMGASAYVHFL